MNWLREFRGWLLALLKAVPVDALAVVLESKGQTVGDFASKAMSLGQKKITSGQRSGSAANKAEAKAHADFNRRIDAAKNRRAAGQEREAQGRRLQQAARQLALMNKPPRASA